MVGAADGTVVGGRGMRRTVSLAVALGAAASGTKVFARGIPAISASSLEWCGVFVCMSHDIAIRYAYLRI